MEVQQQTTHLFGVVYFHSVLMNALMLTGPHGMRHLFAWAWGNRSKKTLRARK